MTELDSVKVLVVDDDDAFHSVMQFVLEEEGYRVLSARSGAEALAILSHEEGVKLIFLDLYMPGMDGFQFANSLRNLSPESINKIPIVVTSATNKPAEKKAASQYEGFLGKPFNLDQLIRVSQEFCQARI